MKNMLETFEKLENAKAHVKKAKEHLQNIKIIPIPKILLPN